MSNHDFYGSTFAEVDECVAGVCRDHDNLQHLGNGEIIRLGPGTALVGYRGWCDWRIEWLKRSLAYNPDFFVIKNFHGLTRNEAFALLMKLGQESSTYLHEVLAYALTCYDHVIVATHVPPFSQGARFDGKPCDFLRQPFYANISMGGLLLRMAHLFPQKRTTILAGHTHCAIDFRVAPNLEIRVGGARQGFSCAQYLFQIYEKEDNVC